MASWAWLRLEGRAEPGTGSLSTFPPGNDVCQHRDSRGAGPAALSPLWKEGCSWTEPPWPRPGVGRAAQGSEPAHLGEQQDTLLRKREALRKVPRGPRGCEPAGESRRRRGLSPHCAFPSTPLLDASVGQDLLPTSFVSEDRTHRKGEQRTSLFREWPSPMGEKSGEEEGAALQEKQVTPG